jgi:hypothetical protein
LSRIDLTNEMAENGVEHIPENIENNEPKGSPAADGTVPEWKASREVILILLCLSVICLMVSLDSTIFVPVLPVSQLIHLNREQIFQLKSNF